MVDLRQRPQLTVVLGHHRRLAGHVLSRSIPAAATVSDALGLAEVGTADELVLGLAETEGEADADVDAEVELVVGAGAVGAVSAPPDQAVRASSPAVSRAGAAIRRRPVSWWFMGVSVQRRTAPSVRSVTSP